MIGPVSANNYPLSRTSTLGQKAGPVQPVQQFAVEETANKESTVADEVYSNAEIDQFHQENWERMLRFEERQLEAHRRVKEATKEWADNLPGQIEGVQAQLSSAGPNEMKDLQDQLASLNSTLMSVSTRYAEMVDGWDEFVAEKNANIAKYQALVDTMSGEKEV